MLLDGSCNYAAKAVGTTCSNGKCNGNGVCDPCQGVTCNSGNSVMGECYQNSGTCSNGSCTYAVKAGGISCSNGQCNGKGVCDPCHGVECNSGNSVKGECYENLGTCSNGSCTYAAKS